MDVCVCRPRKGTCWRNICMKGSLITTVLSSPVLSCPVLSCLRGTVPLPKAQLWVHTVQPVNPVSTLGLGMNAHPPNLPLIDRTEPFSRHMALLLDIRRGRLSPQRTLRTWQEISQRAGRMGWSMRRNPTLFDRAVPWALGDGLSEGPCTSTSLSIVDGLESVEETAPASCCDEEPCKKSV
jgi:hypothetical protein